VCSIWLTKKATGGTSSTIAALSSAVLLRAIDSVSPKISGPRMAQMMTA
jgi:hypothetical protein